MIQISHLLVYTYSYIMKNIKINHGVSPFLFDIIYGLIYGLWPTLSIT